MGTAVFIERQIRSDKCGIRGGKGLDKDPLSPRFSGQPLNKADGQLTALNAEVMSRSDSMILEDDVRADLQKLRSYKKENYTRQERLM